MGCKYICDGCGKEAPAMALEHDWHKPKEWFQRASKEQGKVLDACSRRCIENINSKSPDPMPVAPF